MDGVREETIFEQTASERRVIDERKSTVCRGRCYMWFFSLSLLLVVLSLVDVKQRLLGRAAVDALGLSEGERLLLSHRANEFSLLF